ncbi:MAG: hypothetical protein HY290_19530 [Planctomycetia bacterium]|nr:hypothetical protein [Planctomycetia bacterium]
MCLPLLSGCVLPWCAYPTVSYTPRVNFANAGNVHAFRVDFTNATGDVSVFAPGPGTGRLSRVTGNRDAVSAQIKPAVSYGFVVIGVALNYLTFTDHTMAVRLYRPGFELVEIKSWESGREVAWTSAADLAAQEKALDNLFDQLDPDCKLRTHTECLEFGASEFERLSREAASAGDSQRLDAKARTLREFAGAQLVASAPSDE